MFAVLVVSKEGERQQVARCLWSDVELVTAQYERDGWTVVRA